MEEKYVLVLSNNLGSDLLRLTAHTDIGLDRVKGVVNVSHRMRPGQFLAEIRKFATSVTVTAEDPDNVTRDYTGVAGIQRFKEFFKGSNVVTVSEWYKSCVNPTGGDGGNFYFDVANHGWPGDPD